MAKRYSDCDVSTLESDVMMQMVAKSYAQRFNACSPPKKVEPRPFRSRYMYDIDMYDEHDATIYD